MRHERFSRETCVAATRALLALAAAVAAASIVLRGAPAPDDETRGERLRSLAAEIDRLAVEVGELGRRESGVLGELGVLEAEIRLRRAQAERAGLELEEISAALAERTARLAELERERSRRSRYLAFRLREMYKDGPQQSLRRAVGGRGAEGYLAAQRYAALLSARDAREIAAYRRATAQLVEEREQLAARREELDRARSEVEQSARELARRRTSREALLRSIRDDRSQREDALEELEAASAALDRLADSLSADPAAAPRLDVRKFRGLLDWPAEGRVSEGFGTVTHPRFKTRLPHPGVNIDAPEGADIRNVFDGVVVFASWMRGYGLTAIVDHGGGLLSIYAHASVLMVEPGETLLRGRSLGKVGDSGSLRGPYLYFELREGGTPVDPEAWLRPR